MIHKIKFLKHNIIYNLIIIDDTSSLIHYLLLIITVYNFTIYTNNFSTILEFILFLKYLGKLLFDYNSGF